MGDACVDTGQDSQAGYTLRTHTPVVVRNLSTETRFSGPSLLIEHGVVSGISVIIHAHERPYGVLGAHTTDERLFTENDVNFLQSISNLLSSALERRRVEDTLRESRAQVAGIVESAMDAIITINDEQRIVLFNQAAETMFQCPAGEALDQPLERFIPPRFREVHHHHIQIFGQTGVTNRRMGALGNLNGLRANGEEFPIEASISQIEVNDHQYFTVILRDITERKQLEQNLLRSERQYRGLIESQADLVCRYLPDTTLVFVNKAYCDYLQVSAEAVLGKTFLEFVDANFKQQILGRIEQILRDPAPLTNITGGQNALGNPIWIQWVDYGIVDTTGQVVEIQSVGRDISTQMQAEAVLREERDFSNIVIDSLPGIFYLYDEMRRFLRWNKLFEVESGYSAAEILTMNPLDFIHQDDRSLVDRKIDKVFNEGEAAVEARFLSKTGEARFYYFTGRRIQIGDQTCLAGVGIDITERKQVEIALYESESRYRSLFDDAPIPIWKQDFSRMKQYLDQLRDSGISNIQAYLEAHPETMRECVNLVSIMDVNRAGVALHEGESIQELSENFVKLVDTSATQALSLAALANGQTSFEGEFINRTIQGNEVSILLKWVVLPGYEVTYKEVLVSSINITERKRAEQQILKLVAELEQRVEERTAQLQDVNQELTEFAYIVSHDLKAPLRGVTQLANWVKTDYSNLLDDEGRNMLDLMVGRTKRMHDLIEGILQYSRIGRVMESHTKINVQQLIIEIIDLLAPPPTLQILIPSDLPDIQGEFTQIQQVFQNLIENAIKYMNNTTGKITVSFKDMKAFWEFSIADTGPGIDPQYHDKIFRIFQTLKPYDVAESTGIGLALVKKIIETHRGHLWLESQIGEGSTFYFTLPKPGGYIADAD